MSSDMNKNKQIKLGCLVVSFDIIDLLNVFSSIISLSTSYMKYL